MVGSSKYTADSYEAVNADPLLIMSGTAVKFPINGFTEYCAQLGTIRYPEPQSTKNDVLTYVRLVYPEGKGKLYGLMVVLNIMVAYDE